MIIETIDVPYLKRDLPDEKNYTYDIKQIRLHEDRIEYEIKYRCDSLAFIEEEQWDEDVLKYTKSVFSKESVIGINLIYDYTMQVWAVQVILKNDIIDIHVNTKKESILIFDKIYNWKYEQEESKTIKENSATSEHG